MTDLGLRAVSSLLFGVLVAPAAHAALVAHWAFDEFGGPTAFDSSGNGLHGTLAGGAAFVGGGVSGNAISLGEVTGDLVNMGNVLGGTFTGGDFTIAFWVRTTTAASDTIALSKHDAGVVNSVLFGLNTSAGYGAAMRAWFYTQDSPGQEATSTSVVTDDVWHHVVGVYDAGGQKSIYVDGAPAETSRPANPIAGNAAPFLIGGVTVGGAPTATFDGLIDDVQIYDVALGAPQVQFLFANPGAVVPLPPPVWLLAAGCAGLLLARRRGR